MRIWRVGAGERRSRSEIIIISYMENEQKLEESLVELERLKEQILLAGRDQIESNANFYTFDIYCTGILNKSINILSGFVCLVRAKNFIAAAPLVRIHLDSLLRIFAPHLWGGNVDLFAEKVLDGEAIDKLKTKSGNRLYDNFLATELSQRKGYEWVLKTYKSGSAYVHFSERHIFTSVRAGSIGARTINFVVGEHDNFVARHEKEAAIICMHQITLGILYFIKSWTEQKRGYRMSERGESNTQGN